MDIAVLGSGTIGQSWSALFLAAGHTVTAYDPDPLAGERIVNFVSESEEQLKTLGYHSAGSVEHFKFTTDPIQAVCDAEFIQENAPEDITVKGQLYTMIHGSIHPRGILASSTSGITIEELQAESPFASQMIIGHPFNPPHLIPLVEVLGSEITDTGLIERALEFYRSLGKVPVLLNKSVPGHIANRLQAVLWQEVLYLAKEGVASLSDIDQAIANGPGLRWAIYGPNQLFSLAAGDRGLNGFIDHLGPSFQQWWSSAGQVEFDQQMRDLINQQFPPNTEVEMESMRHQRDTQICQLLTTRRGSDQGSV
jgi:3-hydroxybutyryl-CoA dehydrogenase